MTLIIIFCALALLFGAAILILKMASWLAENAEWLTKLLFGVAVLLLIGASIAQWKPDLCPILTKACNTTSDSIKGFVKPFVN
jgi:hypothetical protein